MTTEENILRCAEAEFMEKGFSGARTVTIAQAAGVTHAMLHYYFRTKEQLFDRVLASKLTIMIDLVFESLDSPHDMPVMQCVESFISKHYHCLADNSKLPLFVINEIVHNPARIDVLKSILTGKLKSIDKAFGHRYAEAIAQGEISSVDLLTLITDVLMLNMSSIVMRPLFKSLTNGTEEDYDTWRLAENITLIRKRLLP